MPSFERYISKNRATTDQPSHFAAESTEGQVTEQVAKATQTAQNLTFKMGVAYKEAQKTQAELNQRTQNDDLLARATADPDYNAYQKYAQENDKIKRESIAGFKNKFTDGEAIAKADYYAKTTDTQLQAVFRKKMLDNQQANLLGLLDKDAAIGDIDGIKARIESNKKQGFINAEDAYKLEEKYVKQSKQNAFLSDLNDNPETAKENLKKNVYEFDFNEVDKAKKMIVSSEKRAKQEFKNTQMAVANEAGELLAKRDPALLDQVDDWIMNGVMDPNMGLNFQLALAGPDKWSEFADENEQRARSKVVTDLLEKANDDDVAGRTKIVNNALQSYNDKKMNSDDLKFILRVASGKSKEPQNKIWGFLKSALSMVANQSPGVQSAKGLMKFKERWDMQEDPRDVMKQAMVDQYKEDKPETAAYKVGDVIKRKSGSYEVSGFNEDGSPVFRKK